MTIILIGMKGCGKTTLGSLLAERLQIPFIDSDAEVEKMHLRESGETLSFRQIFQRYGETYFCALETRTLKQIPQAFGKRDFVLACGGRTPLREENQKIFFGLGKIIFLHVEKGVLLKRILAQGMPTFFPYQDDPERSLDELLRERVPVYEKLADITVDVCEETAEELVQTIMRELHGTD